MIGYLIIYLACIFGSTILYGWTDSWFEGLFFYLKESVGVITFFAVFGFALHIGLTHVG